MTTAVLDELRSIEQVEANDHAEKFRKLVIAAADGALSAEKIRDGLRRIGRTVADLENGVRALRQRREMQDRIIAGQKAAERRAEAEAEIKAADAEFEQARQRHASAVGPLVFEIQQCRTTEAVGHDASRELMQSAGKVIPETVSRLATQHQLAESSYRRQYDAIAREIEQLRSTVNRVEIAVDLQNRKWGSVEPALTMQLESANKRLCDARQRQRKLVDDDRRQETLRVINEVRLDPESI